MVNLILGLVILSLLGCKNYYNILVEDQSMIAHRIPETYIAKSKDNLFKVATKFRLDPHEIANLNRISYPYNLRRGRVVYLTKKGERRYIKPNRALANKNVGRYVSRTKNIKHRPKTRNYDISASRKYKLDKIDKTEKIKQRRKYKVIAEKNRAAKEAARIEAASIRAAKKDEANKAKLLAKIKARQIKVKQDKKKKLLSLKKRTKKVKLVKTNNLAETKSVTTNGSKVKFGIKWQWPVSGQIIKSFAQSASDVKGVDIKNNTGTPIKAAADGVVVYSGSDGGAKYGKLIIINHNDICLSVYAHNNKLLVEEGEDVSKGQLISTMGSTGTSSSKLHFEVRKDGTSIDPQKVLP